MLVFFFSLGGQGQWRESLAVVERRDRSCASQTAVSQLECSRTTLLSNDIFGRLVPNHRLHVVAMMTRS